MKENSNLPIYVVIGTRAQFIKVAPLLRMLLDQKKSYKLIYTAQHKETVDEILKAYKLPQPDVVLYEATEAMTKSLFIKWFLGVFFKMIFQAKKYLPERGYVLTHGDTFTTWMAAIMGKLAGCTVCHLESGLRSFNIFKPFPEELSRLITFIFSDVYFCTNKWAVSNLNGFKGVKVNLEANPMYDGVVFALKSKKFKKFPFQKEKYAVVSIHRYENIFTKRFQEFIIPTLEEIAEKCKLVVTLHPVTRERLLKMDLFKRLEKNKNIIMSPRFDFIDWVNVCSKSEFVITDGGSNQEELSYLGTPTILFRTETERTEGLKENIVLSKLDIDIIRDFVKRYKKYKRKFRGFNFSPSQKIIDYICI